MKNILVIDNYDSFTYNLVAMLRHQANVTVLRNDQLTVDEALSFSHIVLSPGPGLPAEAGIMPALLLAATTQHILGICLGHQAMVQAEGGHLHNLEKVYHGVPSPITLTTSGSQHLVFQSCPQPLTVGRYHSWAATAASLPSTLTVLAKDAQNTIMAISHTTKPWLGLQFHPESILTPNGDTIINNWLAA